jgi:hypothetical protein
MSLACEGLVELQLLHILLVLQLSTHVHCTRWPCLLLLSGKLMRLGNMLLKVRIRHTHHRELVNCGC